ncbi:MAG: hypothetical protein AB1567_13370 [bacterium]
MKFSDTYCEGNRLLCCDVLTGSIGKIRGIGLDDDDEDLCDECNSTTANPYLFGKKVDAVITKASTMIAIFTIGALWGIGITVLIEHFWFR